MRLASWNVNSIRARYDLIVEWLREHGPDVLCLQETKVVDSEFPTETFQRMGYEVARSGQRTYNGVAILSRHAISDVSVGLKDSGPEDDKRLIAGTVQGVRILSAYVPNGKHLDSPSYEEKLSWLRKLRLTLDASCSSDIPLLLCGDFNIARDERDVSEPERMQGQLFFSEAERDALEEVLAFGLVDAFRQFEEGAGLFSWWDYRAGAFRRNRGLRIDYAFVTKPLAERLTGCWMDKAARAKEKPSDHIPVVVDLR
jgi:exodeoxyribonuclease III